MIWMILAVACSTDTPTSAAETIGPDGGTVSQGGASIEIPAGALDSEVEIELLTYSGDLPEGSVGTAWELLPHGQTFAVPVTVSIPVDDDAVELLWSEDGSSWAAVPTTVSDGIAQTETSTFSFTVATPTGEQAMNCDGCELEIDGTVLTSTCCRTSDGARLIRAELRDESFDEEDAPDRRWTIASSDDGRVQLQQGTRCLYAVDEGSEDGDEQYAITFGCGGYSPGGTASVTSSFTTETGATGGVRFNTNGAGCLGIRDEEGVGWNLRLYPCDGSDGLVDFTLVP